MTLYLQFLLLAGYCCLNINIGNGCGYCLLITGVKLVTIFVLYGMVLNKGRREFPWPSGLHVPAYSRIYVEDLRPKKGHIATVRVQSRPPSPSYGMVLLFIMYNVTILQHPAACF